MPTGGRITETAQLRLRPQASYFTTSKKKTMNHKISFLGDKECTLRELQGLIILKPYAGGSRRHGEERNKTTVPIRKRTSERVVTVLFSSIGLSFSNSIQRSMGRR